MAAVAVGVLVAAGVVTATTDAVSAAATTTITVDYGADRGAATQIASGFLHGISASSPAQYLVDGVKVRSQRGADYHPNLPSLYDPATYRRVSATGANLRVGLYYYSANPNSPYRNYRPGDNGNFSTWATIVNGVMSEAEQKGYRVNAWIPWNEPEAQWGNLYTTTYFQTHKVAYDAVKARNSSYRVEAPELSAYNFTKLQQFLTYCRDNRCLPDVLSWHELNPTPTDVPGHTAQIRSWMQANGITPMPIAITEYQGSSYGNADAWAAGPNVRWLAQFERSVPNGLEDALASDWDYIGSDGNFIATLGNSADKATGTLPKGVWWNYNTYKTMTGRMVDVTSSSATTVDALGSLDTGQRRGVLLIGNQTSGDQGVSLRLNNASALALSNVVHVRAERVANTPTLSTPTVVLDADVALSSGGVTLALGTLPGNAVYKVLVTPATASAPTIRYEAESLSTAASPGLTGRVFTEAGASGGAATALDGTAAGQYLQFTLPVSTSGVYHLRALLKSNINRAFQALYVDGVMVGPPQDEYGNAAYYAADYGTLSLSAGNHTLRAVAVGRNPGSSGYSMVYDRFDLVRVGG
ncbi:hypothetical protein TPA0907_30270 [Micromonospora humidisoli]|uniref:hypothetical protein n=1 Tax=Micromonospora sp. AKA109 TaxID=2733865 RepID=UPI0022BFF2BE|nr:hypothetical protein [Micromonospora sp. AKA109]GHJ08660.1 hypothetical protein TPA0907_30270 [Micromonospora sp. AKA109]